MTRLSSVRWLPLTVILLIALAVRFAGLLHIEHNVDRAYPMWQALMTLERGVFPLVGQGTSVLFANPPLTGYLFLPIVALTRSAVALYAFAIVFNSLGVLFTYQAVRSLFGHTAALIGAFLMAVNPWVIEYSRATWVQGLLPFLVPLIASLLIPVWLGTSRRPQARFLAACVALIICAQTYLLAYALIIPVALLTLIYARRMPLHTFTVGALIVLVPTLIYMGALLNNPATTERLESFSSEPPRLSFEALEHAVRTVTGAEYANARGTGAPTQDAEIRQMLSTFAHILLIGALIAGVVRGVTVHGSRRRVWIALLWAGVPVAMMTYVGQIVHPFYQLLGLPAGYALAGYGIAWMTDRKTMPAILVAGAAFGLLMFANSLRYAEETAITPGAHGLGALPLDAGLTLGEMLRDQLPEGGRIHADTDEFILASFSGTTFDFMRDARAPQVTILPAAGGLYVQTDTVSLPVDQARFSLLPLRDGTQIRVDVLPVNPTVPADLTPYTVAGDHGMALEGYRLARTAAGFTLTTAWRITGVDAETPTRLFAPFAHVFNAQGERLGVVDGGAVPGTQWRVGDLHVHQMTFADPDMAFTVSVGQFDAGANLNVIFVLPDGTYSAVVPLE